MKSRFPLGQGAVWRVSYRAISLGGFLLVAGILVAAGMRPWRLALADPPPIPDVNGMAPVNRISMYYAVYGRGHGPPVLLIHGGLSSSDVWLKIIPLLDKTHEVIVADSRGQGRSTQTNERLTYGLMAEDYLALLDTLQVKDVAVVGWSDGGNIGLDLAIHHPDRLTALFAQAANASPDGLVSPPVLDKSENDSSLRHFLRGAKQQAVATFHSLRSDVSTLLGRRPGAPAPTLALQKELFALWATEPHYSRDQLASIKVRTAIVIGAEDKVVRLDHTQYLTRTIPGAHLVILPKVGHEAVRQDPDGYARAVLSFLDGPSSVSQRKEGP
jgi:pimeloyl-ACP methyl ester carboxylesterase